MTITEKLRALKEKGKMVVTRDYIIHYNPFTDTFNLDVPECRKAVSFTTLNESCLFDTFTYDMTGMYPYSVEAAGKSYDEIWDAMEPFANGASTDMIPADYVSDGEEYLWVVTEKYGLVAISRDEIIAINQ